MRRLFLARFLSSLFFASIITMAPLLVSLCASSSSREELRCLLLSASSESLASHEAELLAMRLLEDLGVRVVVADVCRRPITRDLLAGYDLVVFPQARARFLSDEEVEALEDYVLSGGALILVHPSRSPPNGEPFERPMNFSRLGFIVDRLVFIPSKSFGGSAIRRIRVDDAIVRHRALPPDLAGGRILGTYTLWSYSHIVLLDPRRFVVLTRIGEDPDIVLSRDHRLLLIATDIFYEAVRTHSELLLRLLRGLLAYFIETRLRGTSPRIEGALRAPQGLIVLVYVDGRVIGVRSGSEVCGLRLQLRASPRGSILVLLDASGALLDSLPLEPAVRPLDRGRSPRFVLLLVCAALCVLGLLLVRLHAGTKDYLPHRLLSFRAGGRRPRRKGVVGDGARAG